MNLQTMSSMWRVFFLLFTLSTVQGFNGGPPDLSPEQLQYLASLNLCRHFGGTCGPACDRFIVHRWRLPLCDQDRKCCIPETAYQGAEEHTETTAIVTTTIPTTTTSTTTTTTTTTPAPSTPAAVIEGSTHWMEFPADDTELSAGENNQMQSDAQFLGPDLDQCGQMEWARRRKRIVGGSVSPPGAWPWLLALRSMVGAHACSGALVAQRWVVTAAHCFRQFTSPSLWRMRVGEHDLLSLDHTERDIPIDHIYVYPGYKTRSSHGENATLYARYKHDLALVHLAEDAGVEPICLPTGEAAEPEVQNASSDDGGVPTRFRQTALESKGECWVSGWGFTRDTSNQDQVLREVEGDLVNSEDCSEMWGTHLDPDMICFGDGTRGPCAGDSGGPLSCRLNGRWHLAGVVSWGTEDCNVSGYPSVFTRLAPYLSWILSTMQQRTQ